MNAENEKQTDAIAEAYARLHERNRNVIALTTPVFIAAILFSLLWIEAGFLQFEEALCGTLGFGFLGAMTLAPLLGRKRLSEVLLWTWVPSLGLFIWYCACGLASAAPLFVLSNAFGTAVLARAVLRDAVIPFGRCPKCGYDLRGNVSGICPECGEPVDGFQVPMDSPPTVSQPVPTRSPYRWCLILPAVLLAESVLLPGMAR